MNTFIRIFIRNTPVLKSVTGGWRVFLDTVFKKCFKLSICLFDHTRDMFMDTFIIQEKTKVIYFIYMQPRKNEIHICSNKHETGLIDV